MATQETNFVYIVSGYSSFMFVNANRELGGECTEKWELGL